jgi:PAS domain S-box-containing protein
MHVRPVGGGSWVSRQVSKVTGHQKLDWSDEGWLRAIWETSPDAMALSDPEGMVVAANPAYLSLYGYPIEEIVGHPFSVIFPPETREQVQAQYRSAFATADASTVFEAEIRRRDGESRTVESRVSFLTRGERRLAMLSIIRDVTEQKRAASLAERLAEENAALYAQAQETLRLREEFIAMASHELKNPLAALRGFAELLQRRQAYAPNLVDGIILQTARLDRLIRNMLDFSLAHTGHLQLRRGQVDLIATVQLAVTQAQLLTRQHEFRLEAPDEPLIGDWDVDRLDQILQNLLSNAVKYSPDGGTIRIQVEDLGDAARVSVIDQGIGIAQEAIPQLFARFYRSPDVEASRTGGLGLGLSIAHMLVEAHGGQITVESQPGDGSTFSITLPYEPISEGEQE